MKKIEFSNCLNNYFAMTFGQPKVWSGTGAERESCHVFFFIYAI